MNNDILIKRYIINNRMSGMFHPTRDNIIELLYEAAHSSESTKNRIRSYFAHLNGEQGDIDNSSIIKMQFNLMNCCFYFCEYLVENSVDSEVVYNTSDYFVNRIATVKNETESFELLTELADSFFELASGKREEKYSSNVEKTISCINQQLYSPLRVEEIAEKLNLTPQYLTTLFKQETGKTVYKYINDKKLSEAKAMLKYTDDSVTIVASTLGFNSLAHFSAFFKKATGMTPSAFRKSLTKKAE